MIMIRVVLVQMMSSFLLSHVMGLDAIMLVHLMTLCLLSCGMCPHHASVSTQILIVH